MCLTCPLLFPSPEELTFWVVVMWMGRMVSQKEAKGWDCNEKLMSCLLQDNSLLFASYLTITFGTLRSPYETKRRGKTDGEKEL